MNGSGGGPCGACKYLRRKCVRGCVFAPYFDAEQGTGRFAAVHKVFGASNASKMLLRLPSHKRLDAVVTLCYEAFARLRDPVYGPLSHIFSLQHQVVSLQAELAYVQARLSTFQPIPPQLPPTHPSESPTSFPRPPESSDIPITSFPAASNGRHSRDTLNFNASDQDENAPHRLAEDSELHELAMQLVSSHYVPVVKLPAFTSS